MSSPTGLSSSEASERRSRGLGNNISSRSSRSYLQIIRENVFNFINNILYALGIALVIVGRYSDALVSVLVVLTNTLVGVVQEVRAKQVLDRIAVLTRPTVCVLRDGQEASLDPSEIVLGDALVIRPGDQITVDGIVLGDGQMEVDESLLTGESDLIPKRAGDQVYSGSFCVTGNALYEATRVGMLSFANQLTAGAQAFRRVYTPLQKQVNMVIRIVLILAVYFLSLLAIQTFVHGLAMVESVKRSTVIFGLIPNGLLLSIAVAYALGAVRMAGQGALVQQSNAVESLSNVDILCLDKTGTLTNNHIQFQDSYPITVNQDKLRSWLGDYAASTQAGNRTSLAIGDVLQGQKRHVADEAPFSSERKWSGLIFDEPDLRGLYILGAPEILEPYLSPVDQDGWRELAHEWTGLGLRVLLFSGAIEEQSLRNSVGDLALPSGLQPLGLISFRDELRSDASQTLDAFKQAGVQLKFISGDNPSTVAALVRLAGGAEEPVVVSGMDLLDLSEPDLQHVVESTTVFGRVTPQQKASLVETLRKNGHYVAMVGDGINDVLSLKKADLGIAMQSGSQAARSVADLVLLGDSFAALPKALKEGQRILNGMQDILKLYLTRVLYETLLIASLGVVGGFPFAPKHSSLMILLTVGIPTIALSYWAKPGLVLKKDLLPSLFHFVIPAALTLNVFAVGVYMFFLFDGQFAALFQQHTPLMLSVTSLPAAQTALTTFAVFCGLLLILFAEPPVPFFTGGDQLSGDRRPVILVIVLCAVYFLILFEPGLSRFFELSKLEPLELILLAATSILWGLLIRWVWRARIMERFIST